MGGPTIAQAKDAVSMAEFEAWLEYRKLRGPLNPMLRADAAAARICVMVAASKGGRAKMEDFMPWAGEAKKDEGVADLNDLIKILKAVPAPAGKHKRVAPAEPTEK